jgi:N6-L-threonylcarbamoyladenine synthase
MSSSHPRRGSPVTILGIETSCDETSAAVVRDGREILSNVISSQIELHRPYGGVVPEIASRHHLRMLPTVTRHALDRAGIGFDNIDAVAVTSGPGLAPALLIGVNAAAGMALSASKPLIGVNHLEAHLYSPLLTAPANDGVFPMIGLIVSGGHTILAIATGLGRHHVLGQTRDDAAGEAFDKVAKLLGLGYPGGPEIDRLARQGNPSAIPFPRSMLDDASDQFSFSGLKTSVLYHIRRVHGVNRLEPGQLGLPALADICASFQEAVVDVLVGKTMRTAQRSGARAISASGGVSINSRFRETLRAACDRQRIRLLLADPGLCTDNAAMIAALAYHNLSGSPTNPRAPDICPSIGLPSTFTPSTTGDIP